MTYREEPVAEPALERLQKLFASEGYQDLLLVLKHRQAKLMLDATHDRLRAANPERAEARWNTVMDQAEHYDTLIAILGEINRACQEQSELTLLSITAL